MYKSSPAFGIGTAKRSEMANKSQAKFPGAGTYETPSKAVEGRKYAMGSKLTSGSIF